MKPPLEDHSPDTPAPDGTVLAELRAIRAALTTPTELRCLDAPAVAHALGISERSLATLTSTGEGPASFTIGSRRLWRSDGRPRLDRDPREGRGTPLTPKHTPPRKTNGAGIVATMPAPDRDATRNSTMI